MGHDLTIQIPFLSEDHAQLARQVLQVDQELSAGAVKRTIDVQGNILTVSFSILTVRLTRLTLNSFLENLDLITRTLDTFADNPAQQSHITNTTS